MALLVDRPSITGAFWVLPPIFLFLSYHTPRQLWFLYFVSYLLLFSAAVAFVPHADDPADDYAFGTTLYIGLVIFNFFVLSNPHEEHWWSPGNKKSAKSIKKYRDLSLFNRIRWCLGNGLCSRGIGWNWVIPHLPPGPPAGTSKGVFLRTTGKHLLRLYLLHDLSATWLSHITASGNVSIYQLPIPARAAAVLAFGTSVITLMELGYYILCTTGVVTGLFWTRIDDVVPVMGMWSESYTLRRFWGRCWHQNFRRALHIPSRYFAHTILRARKGSQLARHAQSYCAFFISGIYHLLAAKLVCPDKSFHGTLWFLLWQPSVFVVEDLLVWVGKEKMGLTGRKWRWVGRVWTWSVLVVTAAGFVEETLGAGLIKTTPQVPVSLVGLVWRVGEWAVRA